MHNAQRDSWGTHRNNNLPAFARNPFTRAKRVASESVDHYGAVESEQTSVNPRQVFVKTWGISRVKSLAFVTRK